MKRFIPILFAMLTLGLASCSDSTGTGDTGTAGMTCKINGVAWTAGSISKSGSIPSAYIVGSMDKNGLTELLGLHIDSVVAGRVIQLQSDSLSFSANHASYTRSDGSWKTRKGSGTITITELNGGGRVKGTFAFTLYKGGVAGADSLKVTEGTFNSLY
ncbi:MAG: DUF6252 family protein [Candidatus Kapaibacterium sp.]